MRHRGIKGSTEPTAKDLEIYHEVIRGHRTQKDVGQQFKCTQQNIGKIVRKVNAWLAIEYREQIDGLRVDHTRRLEHAAMLAMQGYLKSCEDAVEVEEVITTTGKGARAKSKSVPVKRKVKGQAAGDPAFLHQYRSILEDIRAIWGANVPPTIIVKGQLRIAGMDPDAAKTEIMRRMMKHLGVGAN